MKAIITGIAAVAVISAVLAAYYVLPGPADVSGRPGAVFNEVLTILSSEYRLGESVFMHVQGLQPDERGEILIYTPNGTLYRTIPFDGNVKSEFSPYFYPTTSARLGVCKVSDLVGNWTVVWSPPYYSGLRFEMLPEWVGSSEGRITDEC